MQSVSYGYKLSTEQKLIWQAENATGVPQLAHCIVLLRGAVDSGVLFRALNRVAARQEALRALFTAASQTDIPAQIIGDKPTIVWSEPGVMMSGTTDDNVCWDQMLEQHAQEPLKWQNSILRASLMQCEQEHALCLTTHLASSDLQGFDYLIEQLLRAYGEELRGVELSDDPVQYTSYVEWQKLLPEEELPRIRSALASPREVKFPFERALRNANQQPKFVRLSLGREQHALINSCAKQCEVGTAPFLAACWQILLARISGQSEVVLGVLADARSGEELKGTIGSYSRYLPLTIEISPGETYRSLVRAVEAACSHLNSAVHASSTLLTGAEWRPYDALFDYHTAQTHAAPELTASIQGLYGSLMGAKVRLAALRHEQEVAVSLAYDPDCIREEYIGCLAEQLAALVESAASEPDLPVSRLQLLSKRERQLQIEVNCTGADDADERCFHQLFEEQALRTPEAIALVYGNWKLCYRELNSQANEIALWLNAASCGPEVLVGLAVERSIEMVVGLLGILKSGAAYVPLDGKQPRARLEQVVRQSGIEIALCSPACEAELQKAGVRTLAFASGSLAGISENPRSRLDPDNPAYVIYTSGTSGKLKGVVVPHRALMNYLRWSVQAYCFDQGTGAPVFSPLTFDLTVTALLPPLITGKTLYLFVEKSSIDGWISDLEKLSDLSAIKLTPAHLHMLNEKLGAEKVARLSNCLVIGGENLNVGVLDFWKENAPHTRLINEYGPTEATVGCCIHEVMAGTQDDFATVPIGKPIANTRLYVLDPEIEPLAVGIAGELYIGGAGLARGYCGQPQLTAERFVPDAFSAVPGARLYRTGDLVRRLPNGELDCLGRMDDQVKVRGFRVELSEIESVVRSHPLVIDSAILAVEQGEPRAMQLLGFVVTAPHADLTEIELRAFLEERLPDYMVPGIEFVVRIPLTNNGKVDRKLLLEGRVTTIASADSTFSELERLLAGIFCHVLELKSFGPEENFFVRGGHSLAATQVVARLSTVCNADVSLDLLFEYPVLSDFAKVLDLHLKSATGSKPEPIRPSDRRGPLPLSYAQERLWFVEQLQPGGAAYNMPIALRLRGPLDVGALEQAFTKMVQRHEILRTSFAVMEGVPRQIISPAPEFPLAVLEMAGEAEVQKWLEQEMAKGFNLQRGPLLRVHVLRLGEQEHVLAIVLHHIICDGWSLNVLLREMVTLYEGQRRGEGEGLPELELQYGDYAVWQREWLQGEVLEQQLQYWKRQLGGAPGLLKLPLDRERPVQPSRRGATVGFTVGEGLLQELRRVSQREGATLFMTLVAAFQVLLHYYSGQSDIVVGTDDANRQRGETEGLIGFFINQLALRTDLSGNPSFRKVLQRVRQTTLDAYVHNAAPFEKVVEALNIQRSLQHSPVFQAKLVMQNLSPDQLTCAGLHIRGFSLASSVAKYDLTLTAVELEKSLSGVISYRQDLFNHSTVLQMAESFQKLLQLVVSSTDAELSALRSELYGKPDLPLATTSTSENLKKRRKPLSVAVAR
jgi:amino acid adenylation domain-containing protein